MLDRNPLQLETEIARIARVMMTRNSEIGSDIIDDLRTKLTSEELAGLLLVGIERILWFDVDAVFWTIEQMIPADLMQEIRKITNLAFYKQLINQKFIPGVDFSIDADGKLLLNHNAKAALVKSKG
ncbi:MAG: hypothetical protein CLLPBCKN_001862 [Chroococcidiopsis cubana SAG 39.79]|jgi:hypothetical protein|uniref:Uncharacterized protein n=2 Tax=Chroococcidiopsis TaxID=54298 RepID=K9U0Z4_CHRTP|nr:MULTISPECIES: hypothetical protein [Chroococcidiopsis]MBE9018265.1 hypothetical protein [Chroococcidiopsidales cyanobacterium LEGE 13417]PSB49670.1 hypothetical protein C7B80_01170 [Cyanosarcina cf. burmensis CCALA 770]AFY88121.1 hypothetical protein Chro_2646 [Chroococcidiopsis thermalis PCC 7203]MDZ4872474.1 hypothetical protein [Chroococcidiopsis cubana SAG 39.79]PSB60560.1 hypothetical protein C7B79_25300 [Chroococcidiopsis cubana CCALA 043]